MRYVIDFSYSGANFSGYQSQPNLRTVQNEIEKVLKMINNNKEVKIHSSGRTDAKVNALHQIAHFDFNVDITPYKLKGALNSYLPDDIYINDVFIKDESFHARYSVKSKEYEYKINMGNYNPIERDFVYQYCNILDVENIKVATKYFIGTHDFTTFICAEDKKEDKVRTIYDIKVSIENDILSVVFIGNGFMKYQVRNMVGLLIRVGENREDPKNIPFLFEKKDRRVIYKTAPACGLTLLKVNY